MRSYLLPGLACSLAVALAAGPVRAAMPVTDDGSAYHMMLTPAARAKLGRPDISTAGSMLYYGGSVFSKVKVVPVIWGSQVTPTTVAKIGPFLRAIVNSTYVDQLSEYATNIVAVGGQPGTNQTISRGTYLAQVQITPKNTATTLSDKAVRKELAHQIALGTLPANDLNTLYMIYFPANITIKLGKSVSCQSFGAYHSASSSVVSAGNLFYGVMPDCGVGFAGLTVASSHEFAEAMTDNIPTPGSKPKYPQAWNTSNGYEIGDLCESVSATTLTAGTVTYTVQQEFDNTTNACSTGKFTSP